MVHAHSEECAARQECQSLASRLPAAGRGGGGGGGCGGERPASRVTGDQSVPELGGGDGRGAVHRLKVAELYAVNGTFYGM